MERLFVSRRNALILGAGSLIGSAAGLPSALAQNDVTDKDIFTFALNLEYMEAEYYLRATTGKGINAEDAGSKAGEVTGGQAVKFKSDAIRQFGEELAQNELAHVRFYRGTSPQAEGTCQSGCGHSGRRGVPHGHGTVTTL